MTYGLQDPMSAQPPRQYARSELHGLYAITDGRRGESLLCSVTAAIAGGTRLVQYRDKSADHERRRQEATDLLKICRLARIPLIINDDVALAAEVGADGVHLGQEDTDLDRARARLGPEAIVGVTCHGSLELAKRAHRRGADYVAFGRFYDSASKPGAPPVAASVLRLARRRLPIPIAAIGGITADNGAALVCAGADMLAVIQGLFGADDVAAAACRLAALFDRS